MTNPAPDVMKLREEMRAGLEGVTPGPWFTQDVSFQPDDIGSAYIVGDNLGGLVGAAHAWPTEIDEGDFERVEANAAHIARFDPDNSRALLDALDTQDATILALQERVEELEKGLREAKRDGEIQDELLASQYRAGAQAGWNAQFAVDPNQAIALLTKYTKGDLTAIRSKLPARNLLVAPLGSLSPAKRRNILLLNADWQSLTEISRGHPSGEQGKSGIARSLADLVGQGYAEWQVMENESNYRLSEAARDLLEGK